MSEHITGTPTKDNLSRYNQIKLLEKILDSLSKFTNRDNFMMYAGRPTDKIDYLKCEITNTLELIKNKRGT